MLFVPIGAEFASCSAAGMPGHLLSPAIDQADSLAAGAVRSMNKRVASFLIPILAVVALLYQGLADLQIALMHSETQLIVGAGLAVAVTAGLLAALGGEWTRVVVLSATTVLILDITLFPSRLFETLAPSRRLAPARDARRVADLHQIRDALEAYIKNVGPLPTPRDYGESTGPQHFWSDWWDVSSVDGDGNGLYFLDFLFDRAGVPPVPLDPLNVAPDAVDPKSGSQYVYFVVPQGYTYEGGVCPAWQDQWVYMLAITRLEADPAERPEQTRASACDCLWRDKPNFFQEHFDYLLCGTFKR